MKHDPDEHAVTAAWLHDTVEKGSMRLEDLWEAGASRRLVEVVEG